MIIRAYNTAKCQTVSEHRARRILAQSDKPEEARESCQNDWMPFLCFETDAGTNMCIPVYFVIEIKEEEK